MIVLDCILALECYFARIPLEQSFGNEAVIDLIHTLQEGASGLHVCS